MATSTSIVTFPTSNNTGEGVNTTSATTEFLQTYHINFPYLYNAGFLSATAEQAYDWFTYIIPCLAFTCNALSIAVFLQRRSQKSPVSTFLVALACCDVMAVMLMFYMAYSRLGWWTITTTACKAVVYINGVGRMSSIWITVFFTTERFIAVRYVFRRADIVTPLRVRLAIVSLLCAMMVEQSFIVIWVEAIPPNKPTMCFTMDESIYHKYMLTLVIVNRLFNFILPLVLVTVMNTFIVIAVRRSSHIPGKIIPTQDHHERRLTRMLVLVSSVSFLLLLPETTSKIMESINHFRPPWLTEFTLLTDAISYLNHCLNFFFYVISGRQFRKGLVEIFTCHCRNRKKDMALTSPVSRTASTHTSQVSIISSVQNITSVDLISK